MADDTTELIPRVEVPPGRVGIFAIGHEPYWEQFPGLRARLEANAAVFREHVAARGVEVVDGGLVDTSRHAAEVGEWFRTHPVDLLFCFVATYATSAVVLPVVQRAGAGVVLFGLQ
ncbi:MAG TPA: arabinose isomerase, partial [Limnochordia bacterium]